MAIKDSLTEVSSSLAKILQQLRDIEAVQDRLSKSSGAYARSLQTVVGGSGSQSVGGSGFSTPPPPVGSQLGGVTQASSGAMVPGGAAGFAAAGWKMGAVRAGALTGAALATAAWTMTPSLDEVYANQAMRFRASFWSPQGYQKSDWDKMRAIFGSRGETDPYGMITAANISAGAGNPYGTQNFTTVMKDTADTSLLFGMSTPAAATAQNTMLSGTMAGRLARSGIFVSDFETGQGKGFGNLINQIYNRSYAGRQPGYENINADIRGGYLGSWMRRTFGDSPELYEQVRLGLLAQQRNGGKPLDFGSGGVEGSTNAYAQGEKFGLNKVNDPTLQDASLNSQRADLMESVSEDMLTGYRSVAEFAENVSQAMEDLAESGNPAVKAVLELKGALQAIAGNSETAGIMGAITGILGALGNFALTLAAAKMLGGKTGVGGAPKPGGSGGSGARTRTPTMRGAGAAMLGVGIGTAVGAGLGSAVASAFGVNPDYSAPGTTFVDTKGMKTVIGQDGQSYTSTGFEDQDYAAGFPTDVMDLLWPPGMSGFGFVPGTPHNRGGRITGAGSSTSDNVHALLSPGEYVINARAAQTVGHDTLDAINSMGKTFGSAYASPARNFDGGGCVTDDNGTACPGDITMDGWVALAYGDDKLGHYKIEGAPGIETGGLYLLSEKGIGDYLASFATAWQANPALGGNGLDLNDGWSGGHALRMSSNGKVSNHSAGVAMDLRADALPVGTSSLSSEQMKAIRALLGKYSKLEWGGDWSGGDTDEMHFEISSPGNWGEGGVVPDPETTTVTDPAAAQPEEQETSTTGRRGGPTRGAAGGFALSSSAPSVLSMGGILQSDMGLGLGSSFSWISSLFGKISLATGAGAPITRVGQSDNSASQEVTDSAQTEDSGSTGGSTSHPDPGDGSGPKWLYDFLISKGLRGGNLKTAWVIGMRESTASPTLVGAMDRGQFYYPDVPSDFDPTSENWRGGRYDVGLFQINSQHKDKVRAMTGGDMLSMIDPDNNFEMLKSLSSGMTNWAPWGIASATSSGFNYIDWSTWGGSWASTWGPQTEQNDAGYLQQYEQINVHGYSEGAYRTHNELAQLHEGEMVLPAAVAEQFRSIMREMGAPGNRSSGPISITLNIEKASDAEAERFAKKVKSILEQDSWEGAMRTR